MREQVGAGRCMVGGDLNLPAGHGLDCEDVSANGQKHANNTAQLPWPGKRRKMFLKKLATGKWGNECVSCVLNASLIFLPQLQQTWLAAPPAWISSPPLPICPCPNPILRFQTLNPTMTAMIDRCTSPRTFPAGMRVDYLAWVWLSARYKVHEPEFKSFSVCWPKILSFKFYLEIYKG